LGRERGGTIRFSVQRTSSMEICSVRHLILNFLDIPLILETPFTDEGEVQKREIQLLTDMAEKKCKAV
jgi:endonuclease IV